MSELDNKVMLVTDFENVKKVTILAFRFVHI